MASFLKFWTKNSKIYLKQQKMYSLQYSAWNSSSSSSSSSNSSSIAVVVVVVVIVIVVVTLSIIINKCPVNLLHQFKTENLKDRNPKSVVFLVILVYILKLSAS